MKIRFYPHLIQMTLSVVKLQHIPRTTDIISHVL